MIPTRRFVLSAAAGFALARPTYAQTPRIPFEHANGKVLVPVLVNGQPVQAMLDSGSAFIGLDTAFAQAAGVKADGRRVSVRGVQHAMRGRMGELASLSVGNAVLRGAPVVVTDYSSLSATVGRRIEMALGGPFFRRFVVDLDFEDQSLAVFERAAFVPPPRAVMVPLSPYTGLMTAPVTIGAGRPLNAIVDTGSDAPLLVSPAPAQRLALFKGRSSTAPIGGVGGGAIARIASAPSVTLGGATFADVPVQGPPASLGPEANLGLGLLSRFRLWLDFGGRRMWLRPAGGTATFRRDLLGVYGEVQDDRIRITHVAPGSPAAAAGFKAGEVIAAFNGESAARANYALRDAPEGTPLAITLAGGATRRVILAMYY